MSDAPSPPRRGDALLVAAFALVVQVAQRAALADDPSVLGPIIDGRTFHTDAVRLLTGAAPAAGLYWQSPWFVWALAGTYKLFGPSPARGLLLQSALAIACAALVHALAKRLELSRREALVAGAVAAVYGPLLFFASQLIAAPLDAAAALVALLAAIAAPPEKSPRWHALSGLALGFAAAQRGTVWPFALWSLAALWRARGELGAKGSLSRAGAYVAGAVVASLPVALGNLRRAGSFTTLTTNAGVNLWLGNNPDIARTTAARPGCGWDWITLEPVRHGVFSSQGRSRWFTQEALRWALEHPLNALTGTLKKLSDTFNGYEVPRNLDPYGDLARTPFNAAMLGADGLRVPFGLVLPLAVLGGVALLRAPTTRRATREVIAFAALNGLGIALFLPAGRYRLGLALALVPLAVAGGRELGQMLRKADPPRALPVALTLAAGLFANLTPRFTGPDLSRSDALLRAEAHMNAGQLVLAESILDGALAQGRSPGDMADHLDMLSRVCAAKNSLPCAEEALARAIALEPRCYDAAGRLGALRLARGDGRGAIDAFERSARVVPMQPATWFGLAAARAMAGDAPGAARARTVAERLRDAVRRAP